MLLFILIYVASLLKLFRFRQPWGIVRDCLTLPVHFRRLQAGERGQCNHDGEAFHLTSASGHVSGDEAGH